MKVISNPDVSSTLMRAAILKMADSKLLLFFKFYYERVVGEV